MKLPRSDFPYFVALATGNGMLDTWKEYELSIRKGGAGDVQRKVHPETMAR